MPKADPIDLRLKFPMLRHFHNEHLPPDLAAVSGSFTSLAYEVAGREGDSWEIVAALRKLLEAKDCAVRAAVREGEEEFPALKYFSGQHECLPERLEPVSSVFRSMAYQVVRRGADPKLVTEALEKLLRARENALQDVWAAIREE